jgi:two-component system cell cycle sensor histidine kinase/response regulator CckA
MRHPAGDQSFADIMQIKQNANRAANLVRQLLAFSRKQTLQPKVISITDTLADLSNLIGRLIGENIKLNILHGRDLGLVRVDQGQLEQVIINLAGNARDAIDSDGVLTIQTQNFKYDKDTQLDPNMVAPAEDDIIEYGEYVLLEITDTGSGINRELLGKIFEPFFSTKEVGSGTGLGLSTVYGIIKQTDGYVYVKSEKGKGTTFSIFLKRHKEDPSHQLSKAPESSEISVASEDLTGKGTILLVEDEAPVRAFSASALMNKGYTVLEAESGHQALDIVKEAGGTIQLIISDVIMPGLNGTAMVEEIRKNYPDIPVIFISGYAEDMFEDHYTRGKEFNFLPKPYTLKQLASKVKEVLQDSSKKDT